MLYKNRMLGRFKTNKTPIIAYENSCKNSINYTTSSKREILGANLQNSIRKLKKITLSQTKKYDVDQKIIHELANLESRHVLFSIVKQAKTPAEISSVKKIPLSTVYLKLGNLEKLFLIYVEKTELENGRKIKYYKSKIKGADISISKQKPKLILIKNKS